jgi:hypothetical protein
MTSSVVGVRVPPASRGRATWVIPLLLFLAMLLAAGLAFNLAHLDTGGEAMPGPGTSGSTAANPFGLFDPQTAQILLGGILVALLAVTVLVVLMRRRGMPVKRVLKPMTWTDLLASLAAFSMLVALLALWPQIVARLGHGTISGNTSGAGTANTTVLPTAGGIPLGAFLAGAVLASLVALALFLRLGLNLGRPGPSTALRRQRLAAAQAVGTAITDLQLGGDVRTVILACYGRFCYFLGMRGIEEQQALTPRELEGLAIRSLAVSEDSADSLTSLFEEARYSEHALGDPDRERAVQSLERIRADLGV